MESTVQHLSHQKKEMYSTVNLLFNNNLKLQDHTQKTNENLVEYLSINPTHLQQHLTLSQASDIVLNKKINVANQMKT